MSELETFEEWRVTGDPGYGCTPYEFVWSPDRNPHLGDPEAAARAFVAAHERGPSVRWVDGPHLSHRAVTRTAWEEATQ